MPLISANHPGGYSHLLFFPCDFVCLLPPTASYSTLLRLAREPFTAENLHCMRVCSSHDHGVTLDKLKTLSTASFSSPLTHSTICFIDFFFLFCMSPRFRRIFLKNTTSSISLLCIQNCTSPLGPRVTLSMCCQWFFRACFPVSHSKNLPNSPYPGIQLIAGVPLNDHLPLSLDCLSTAVFEMQFVGILGKLMKVVQNNF